MVNEMKKGGQVTMFIILGIVIVTGIIAALFFMGGNTSIEPSDLNPKESVDKCVRDAVKESVETILSNGGVIIPKRAIMYQDEEWNYLCYQADYYQGCYNIHPMLEMEIEDEIVADTQGAVQDCFDSMREDFENRGFDVSGGAASYSVDVLPGAVEVSLKKKLHVTGEGSTQDFENFDTKIISPIYDLIRVARDVVNSESQYCHFEYNGYMLLYPEFDIRRVDYSDSKLYRLIDRRSGIEFKFAVRSCAFAPGI